MGDYDLGIGKGIVFFIASHRNPSQVVRLIERLKSDLPLSTIVLHHDRSKAPFDPSALPPDIDVLQDSIAARWGDASLIRLTTRGIEHIVERYPEFAWIVFISGQDYPVRNLRDLPGELSGMGDGELSIESLEHAQPLRYQLAWFRLPNRLQTTGISRLFDRLIYHLNHRQTFVRFASGRIGNCIGIRLPSPFPRRWRVFQGSQWWSLSRRAILRFVTIKKERPSIYDWFVLRTIIPDEGLFQTLLHNQQDLNFSNRETRYKRWDDRNSGSPAIFTVADLEELQQSGCFFARKFDTEVDTAILDALDSFAK